MSTLHLFNPENDLALAANSIAYTPPAAAIRLRHAGALLPMLWAEPDDYIIAEPAHIATARCLKDRFGLSGQIVERADGLAISRVVPWGWSDYTCRRLIALGVDPSLLPSQASIDRLRSLSNRRTSIAIHRHLDTPNEIRPREFIDFQSASREILSGRQLVVKLPWSGSGRGVLFTTDFTVANILDQIQGILRHQGSVIIEPMLQKVTDFAALFHCDGSAYHFKGISLFTTDHRGAYSGNILASQDSLLQRIDIDLTDTISRIGDFIATHIAPHYHGWLGVDMMTYRDPSGALRLNPCVELNLRATMGVAALSATRLLPSTTEGLFKIERTTTPAPHKIYISPPSSPITISISTP